MVVAQHNPSTKEVEAGRSGVQGRSQLYSKLKHNEVGLALRSSTLRVPPTGSTLPGDHPELCLTSTKSAALSSPANHPLSTGHPCFPMCGLKGSLRCHHTHTHTHTTETGALGLQDSTEESLESQEPLMMASVQCLLHLLS